MMLYSDGLVEAMSPDRKMYGMKQLEDAMARSGSTAQDVLETVLHDMQKHVGEAPQFDDTTVVCLSLDVPIRKPSGRWVRPVSQ